MMECEHPSQTVAVMIQMTMPEAKFLDSPMMRNWTLV
jgi:hypothetical protein